MYSKTPTVPGQVTGDNTVCTGVNTTLLTLSGQNGNIITWLSSPNGISWTPIANTSSTYTAQNLTTTTQFVALVQNGSSCSVDTSTSALVTVDPKSVGGTLDPSSSSFCANQNVHTVLTLNNYTGNILNWQSSGDGSNWSVVYLY